MRKFRLSKDQITWGITIFLTAAAVMIFVYLLYNGSKFTGTVGKMFHSVAAILVGIVIGYVLSPVLNFIERSILAPIYKKCGIDVWSNRRKLRQMRAISVAITIIFFILMLYALIMIVVPQLFTSIQTIIKNIGIYQANVEHFFNDTLRNNPQLSESVQNIINDVTDKVEEFISSDVMPKMSDVMETVSKWAVSIVKGFFNFFVGIIVSVYVLYSKDKFCAQGKKLAYAVFKEKWANEVIGLCRYTHYTFIGFISGKILDSLIIGILCFIGTTIIGTPFPVLVSFIVGVTNVIPFFGPYIGAIICSILVFMIDPLQALFLLIFIIALQQFDGNILGPWILGDSTGLSSFWVIFAIMFCGGIWGVMGWIIGVPIFAVFYHIVGRIVRHFLRVKNLPTDTHDYYDIAYMEGGAIRSLRDPDSTAYHSKRPGNSWKRILRLHRIGKKKSEGK